MSGDYKAEKLISALIHIFTSKTFPHFWQTNFTFFLPLNPVASPTAPTNGPPIAVPTAPPINPFPFLKFFLVETGTTSVLLHSIFGHFIFDIRFYRELSGRTDYVSNYLLITPADEKTHGFNRVDDSPQIFNYV